MVTLDGKDYQAALNLVAELGLTSGAVYDALHVCAAEKANADELVTLAPLPAHASRCTVPSVL